MSIHRNALKIKAVRRELRMAVEDYRAAREDPEGEANEAAQRVADLCVTLADLEAEK